MTECREYNKRGTQISIGRCYHVTWARDRGYVFALDDVDWATRRAYLRPPKQKKHRAFWTDLDSLYATHRNAHTDKRIIENA